MITLNEKVQALIDLLELETENHESYITIFLDKGERINMDLTEKDDIQSAKKKIFNQLYRDGRCSYKEDFVEDLRCQVEDFDSPLWNIVYDYKNPFE